MIRSPRHGGRIALPESYASILTAAPLEEVRLRFNDNTRHHRNCGCWILTRGGLCRKHDCVCAVENRICYIRGFRARGQWILNHRLEHLSGRDDQLGTRVRRMDNMLLQRGHALGRELYAEVTARHHHPINHIQDGFELVHGFRLFELCNQ